MSVQRSIIVAHDLNRVIGNGGELPWAGRTPADMAHFKEKTIGNTVLMGRVTFEGIYRHLGSPLPRRKNVVMTRDQTYEIPGVSVVHSLEEALEVEVDGEMLYIAGGEKIYQLFMPYIDRLLVTEIDAAFEGDAFFVDISPGDWELVSSELHPKDGRNDFNMKFLVYERKQTGTH